MTKSEANAWKSRSVGKKASLDNSVCALVQAISESITLELFSHINQQIPLHLFRFKLVSVEFLHFALKESSLIHLFFPQVQCQACDVYLVNIC